MKEREALKLALDALKNNKQTHYYCEDTWYSCPKHEDGCANDLVGDECNCGADKANAEIDQAITAIEEALAQTEQEPVIRWKCKGCGHEYMEAGVDCDCMTNKGYERIEYFTTPQQRNPLTDRQIWDAYMKAPVDIYCNISDLHKFARAIEAAHGIKE